MQPPLDALRALIFAIAAFFALVVPAAAFQADIVGRASVVDGDTIAIHGQRIRLDGIDAPEARQTCDDAHGRPYRCGAVAADALAGFLAQSVPTACHALDRDRWGRIIADCRRADGRGVADWLVRHGHALDWPRYSRGAHAAAQAEAQAARRGMWAGSFVAPWDWRRR